MYHIQINKIEKYSLDINIKGFDLSLINSLRRVLIAEVPSLTIDKITILKNESIMDDEVLIQRLELIPLKSLIDVDVKNVIVNFNYLCEKDEISITSNFLKFNNEYIFPISNNIEIVKLKKGESLIFHGIVKKGIGRNNAKWCSVTVVSFKQIKEEYNTFKFKMETTQIMECKELLLNAIKIIKNKLTTLKKSTEKFF